jgi:heat shock protein HtpX
MALAYQQIDSNKRKTLIIIVGFVLFMAVFGWVLELALGRPGLLVGISIFAIVYAIFGYYLSDRLALALSGAKSVTKAQAPLLYRTVENLSIAAGLPTPAVYVVNDPAPNAFATGRDPRHASVAATTGLLEIMNDKELEGVIGHELSHVGNYDVRLMAVVLVMVTILSVVSNFFVRFTFWGGSRDDRDNDNSIFMIVGLVFAILAPIIGTLVQLAVSRRREYLADASGALLTRYPEGLVGALEKIQDYKQPTRSASPAIAHLYFSNPFRGAKGKIAGLFSTHPPLEDRIKRLRDMEGKQ